MLQAAVAWAAMHSVDSLAEAATVWDHGETGMPVAGPGAPLVGEFSVTEFAAAIGLPDRGRQGLPRRGRRAPLPPGSGLVPGGQGRPARLAGPPGRPRDHGPVAGGGRVRGPPRRARGAQGRPRPGRPAGGGGDRAVHARGGRTPPPAGRRRPVLHHRHEAAVAAGHQRRVRGARPRRRPRPRRRRRRRRAGAEGPRLHRHPGRAPGHRGRGPRPPPAHPRPQPHHRRTTSRRTATRRPPAPRPATATRRSGPADLHGRHEEDPQAASGGAVRAPLRRRRGPRRPAGGRVRAGREHQGSGARRADPAVVRQPRRRDHRAAGARPERAHRRRGLRDPRPAAGTDHPDPPDLRVPLVHPTRPRPGTRRARRRLRPPGPLREGPAQLLLQRRPVVPAASPGQDPRRLVLHRPRTRDVCVDQPARVPVPARPPRHPRRVPRPAPRTRRTPAPTPRTTDSTAPHPAGPPPAGTSARPGQSRTVPTGATGALTRRRGAPSPSAAVRRPHPQARRTVAVRASAVRRGPPPDRPVSRAGRRAGRRRASA